MPTLSPIPAAPTHLRPWTVAEYHQLSDIGILDADERTELVTGQILLMAAKGIPHVITLRLLASALQDQLLQQALVWTQDPIQLDDYSEPEPDLALVKGQTLDYVAHHPQPADIYLVVEVADSSLKYDCEVKAKLYAQAGIQDYWVIDVNQRQLHCFRDLAPTGYTRHTILSEPASLSPLAFPDLTLTLTAILPPRDP